jgi:basic amino acid/polyamine antiporter, APA family
VSEARPSLERRLGTLDAALLTIGSVVGTGIFLTGGEVARALPSPGAVLLVWLVGGALALAGALTYAELGAMNPRAGGLYAYLADAYGPLWGFFYGWACLLVIMSGGIAAIAVGFGEYLGTFLPFFASDHALFTARLGTIAWSPSGAQLAAALAILVLTAVNHVGLRAGAGTQNALTALRLAAIAAFVGLGAFAPAPAPGAVGAPPHGLLAGFGIGMIAALWTYDGWYGATFSAGEMRDPGRTLPRGIVAGVLVVTALYLAMNALYLRALPGGALAASTRNAEDAARVLFGAGAARLMALAVVLASFGCLASTILYSSRIYQPMAEDGVFFRSVVAIHPRFHTPVRSLWLQSLWAAALALTGSYVQLFTWVTFAGVLFHVLGGAAIFVLRRRRPDAARPYRAWGYPLVPALFTLGMLALVASTLWQKPAESLIGLAAIAAGWPAYAWWRRGRGGPRIRPATLDDVVGLGILIGISARGLGAGDYTPEQIAGALEGVFGVDTQLIRDGTYFVAESGGTLVGCGGWSRRATRFGSDVLAGRDAARLDPRSDAARIRAFFVHPQWSRRGIARALLRRCEDEAAGAGFRELELVATLTGERFYATAGYAAEPPVDVPLPRGGVLPCVPMRKALAAPAR